MKKIAESFPYFEVEFDKQGRVADQAQADELLNFVAQNEVTDLFAISHGWNNDMAEARQLYEELFRQVRTEIESKRPSGIADKRFAVFGILWPSKKFADDENIPSGAASLAAPQVDQAELVKRLEELKGFFDNPTADTLIQKAQALVPQIAAGGKDEAEKFADLLRSLPGKQEISAEDNSDRFFKISANELVDSFARPDVLAPPEPGMGGAAGFEDTGGEAAGLKDLFGGILASARKVLNFTTYYQMKERAGVVGRQGVSPLLKQIRQRAPQMKVHLIGHSFGARLVTAAIKGLDGSPETKPHSLTLLQAAFSHNGFASKFDGKQDGFFRAVVTKKMVSGPIIITHSVKDQAVGIAYPLASKLSGDDAAGLGGPDDRFGGLGRNGAQHTPEAVNTIKLGPNTFAYAFEQGSAYNLNADAIIQGHSDICRSEVAHALLCAVATT